MKSAATDSQQFASCFVFKKNKTHPNVQFCPEGLKSKAVLHVKLTLDTWWNQADSSPLRLTGDLLE